MLGKSSNYCWVIFQQAMFEDSGGYTLSYGNVDRRKFRSQISDNMNRWKSRGGKTRVREEKESVERRSEKRKSQKKEDAKHCFSNVLWLRRAEK